MTVRHAAALVVLLGLLACGSDDASTGGGAGSPGTAGLAGDAQHPPTTSAADIEAWLANGEYRAWKCETEAHAGRDSSPHGRTRICSNDDVSAHGDGEFPIGSASVKEVYDGDTVVGHAFYRKVAAGSGDAFHWYEKLPSGLVTNGTPAASGASGGCVGCHAKAGSGPGYTGHDLVFTQIR